MKVVLRKGTTYSLTTVLIFGVFGSLVYLMSYLYQDYMSPVALTVIIVAVFIGGSLFQPVLSRLQHTVDRWFFRERYRHIQTLKQFTLETKGALDLEQLASSLVSAVANGMQCQDVYLLLPSTVSGNFGTYTYYGQKARWKFVISAGSPLVAALKQRDDVIDCNEIDMLPSLTSLSSHDRKILKNNGVELIVPLKSDGHLAGILFLGNKASHEPYSYEERRLLQTVAADVAVNIENANYFENIKQKHSQLQRAMDGVVHAVSLVVESRDPYTAGHQRRVAELSRAIAREMNLTDWQIMGIYIAGLLHDVGKVAVPAEILSKPGKINASEFDIIKNHCRVGYDILRRIDFPWPVTRAILQHHERLDGSGYPAGIFNNDIIMEAKILGVADVVEAMSSHRPYRPALGLDRALEEIKRGSGTLYDTNIVDACVRLLGKNPPKFDRIMAAAKNTEEYVLEVIK